MDTPLPRTAPPNEVLRAALEALDRGQRVIIASVVARRGSAPSTPGQKLALRELRSRDFTAVVKPGPGSADTRACTYP